MALGIALTIFALIGIIYGIVNKLKAFVIASGIVLIFIATTIVYFYKNPY